MTKRPSQLAHLPFWRRAWILLLAKFTPDCDLIVRWASESMERRLTLRERALMKIHFWICSFCKRYLAQIQMMHHASCHLHEHEKPAVTLGDEEKAKLKAALRGETR